MRLRPPLCARVLPQLALPTRPAQLAAGPEDGRIAYRMKRPLPDGTTRLFFTGLELLRRLASLVPPPRANLTRFHGVFAPGAKLRPFLLPQAWAGPKPQEASPPPEAPPSR